jgi:hypothetical protein
LNLTFPQGIVLDLFYVEGQNSPAYSGADQPTHPLCEGETTSLSPLSTGGLLLLVLLLVPMVVDLEGTTRYAKDEDEDEQEPEPEPEAEEENQEEDLRATV